MIALVSACLVGINCRYDGGNVLNRKLLDVSESILLVPVCPEQLAGFPTPRVCCEIVGGDGFDVLSGNARVVTVDGRDVTGLFVRGAEEVLKVAKLVRAELAVMKDLSPSCGCGTIYDGSFSGSKRRGFGVTSAMLKLSGFDVVGVDEFLSTLE